MARALSHIICICGRIGGTLAVRKAGRGSNGKKSWFNWYWYVGHYDRSKPTRKAWCYIGQAGFGKSLSRIITDSPNYGDYLGLVREFYSFWHSHLDFETEKQRRAAGRKPLCNVDEYSDQEYEMRLRELQVLLESMGWPKKHVIAKISEDLDALRIDRTPISKCVECSSDRLNRIHAARPGVSSWECRSCETIMSKDIVPLAS